MYNTNFVVKYHDIERELVINLRKKALKKQEANSSTKKGGKKKVLKEKEEPIKEEPKKRGRKKAVKEEPIKEEVTKEEPIKETPVTNEEEDDNEDIEYTMDDVHLICEKLYRDELLSVFEVETINDGNMDAGIKKVIEKMIENPKTKKMLEDIKHDLVDFSSFTGTPTEMENIRRNADYIIFITLFSQHIFYITHICVCQLFTSNDIDDELVNLLKERMINLFKKN